MENISNTEWQVVEPKVFWGEIAPTEHVVQIYENDEIFLDMLEGFVVSGFHANECVVIVASTAHLTALATSLNEQNYDVTALQNDGQLMLLNAEDVLAEFMINDWPDSKLFNQTVSAIVSRAQNNKRNMRVFGEMVAILWAKGEQAATVYLENLWNRFCETQSFCLFCAYPKSGFTQDVSSSIHSICCTHAKMISGEHRSKTKLFYKTVMQQAS